jgi:RNA polymerase sigma-70 factor (ECF subfamily)
MRDRPFPFARRPASIAVVTEPDFAMAVARHRGELHRHCVRLVGHSDADDALQETLLRAWRSLHTQRAALRPWLYRIATNACHDVRARQPADAALDEAAVAPCELEPEALVIAKETVELALLTALRRLPERQHGSLLLRDVLSCSAGETASVMSLSVPATNSALQRGRAGLRARLGASRLDWAAPPPTSGERQLLAGLVAACT